jgi:hypothetical protein
MVIGCATRNGKRLRTNDRRRGTANGTNRRTENEEFLHDQGTRNVFPLKKNRIRNHLL